MSWMVSLLKLNKDVQHVENIDSEDIVPLGTKAEILALLKKWFPDADYHDPSWISFDGRDEVSEIIVSGADELDDNSLIESLGFRNPSYRLLRDVCARMGWTALDQSDGDFIDFGTLPQEYFSNLFMRKRSQGERQTLTDFIIYLRNQVLETWISGNKGELRRLANTLRTLGESFSETGDNTYWTLVDKLTYFAEHAEVADYSRYIPTEEAIRELEPK